MSRGNENSLGPGQASRSGGRGFTRHGGNVCPSKIISRSCCAARRCAENANERQDTMFLLAHSADVHGTETSLHGLQSSTFIGLPRSAFMNITHLDCQGSPELFSVYCPARPTHSLKTSCWCIHSRHDYAPRCSRFSQTLPGRRCWCFLELAHHMRPVETCRCLSLPCLSKRTLTASSLIYQIHQSEPVLPFCACTFGANPAATTLSSRFRKRLHHFLRYCTLCFVSSRSSSVD